MVFLVYLVFLVFIGFYCFFLRIIGIFYEELVNGTLLVVDNIIFHIASCIKNILRCQIASAGAVAKWDDSPTLHCAELLGRL